MNKIEKGSIKSLAIQIIAISIMGIILYPLFDLVCCKFITNSEFVYSIHSHIIYPISFGFIMGTINWLIEKNKSH